MITTTSSLGRRVRWLRFCLLPLAAGTLVSLQACESSTPEETPLPSTGGSAGTSSDAGGNAGTTSDSGGNAGTTIDSGGSGGATTEAGPDTPPAETSTEAQAEAAVVVCNDSDISTQDNSSCTPLATDYKPADTANDTWAACISDDNQYHPFDTSISSIARVGAFVEIAKQLSFGLEAAPTVQNFTDARLAYQADEGLESRVSRREDEHYPKAPDACNKLSTEDLAKYPDRCVGPFKIQPLLNTAFQQGMTGVDPAKNAARIEAGLLWFLYVSVHKEATTCITTAKDCDSSYAYYTGGEPRDAGLGFAKYVKTRSPQAHDRIWDGILATRCWRDQDNPTGAGTNTTLQSQALAQLDRALLRGVALIVRQRVQKASCDPMWEFVKILGPVLGREAAVRDATKAQVLATEFAKDKGADVDINAVVSAIDAIFPCP